MPDTDLIGAKALEADFFLREMHAARADLFAFRCYFSGFVSAARAMPRTMEMALGTSPAFASWSESWQHRFSANRIARFFAEVRVETQRIGHTPVHQDRSRWVPFGLWETKHYFAGGYPGRPEDIPELDVLEACTEYLTLLAEFVLDCHEKFAIRIPAALWTVPGLARIGTTIDDIEESLGFPRGWTVGEGRTDQERLTLLRLYSPDTPLDRFFLRYLNRTRRPPVEPTQPPGRP